MKFKRIYIEITNRCNLDCPFCGKNTRQKQDLTSLQFQSILDQIEPYGKYLYLHVQGEPLLHPQLNEILTQCDQRNFQVQLVSNGTLLSQNKDMLLHHSCLRKISFSLHSLPHHPIIDTQGYLQSVVDFSKQASTLGLYVELRLWNRQYIHEDLLAKSTLHYLFKQFHRSVEEMLENQERSVILQDHLFLHFDERFEWPNQNSIEFTTQGTCHGGKDMFAVLVNGDVVPCCLDHQGACTLGNLFVQPLSTILSSSRFTNLVQGFKEQNITEPICQKCTYRLRFNKSH